MKKISGTPAARLVFAAVLLAGLLLAVFFINKCLPMDYEMYDNEDIYYLKGVVSSVNAQSLEESADLPGRNLGVQNITVRMTQGELRGKEITFDNQLSTTHSIEVAKGTRVVVKCDMPEGVEPYYSLYQYDRTIGIAAAFGLLLVLIFIVGKAKGVRAALGLLVTAAVIAGVLVPLVYNGFSPVLVTVGCCALISFVTLFLLNGFCEKTAVAVLSTVMGLLLTALFYGVFSRFVRVTGYNLEETEELILIFRSTGLKIGDILFSGILVSCLGAVTDTAMSVASALWELYTADKKLSYRKLLKSGMNIGSDMIGTMCQTLVLAFTGGSLAAILVTVAYGTSLNQFLSSDFFALEVLRALTGSVAVVLCVPITSILCAVIFKRKRK